MVKTAFREEIVADFELPSLSIFSPVCVLKFLLNRLLRNPARSDIVHLRTSVR